MNKLELEILFDQDDIIAVSKPAGWLTIPGRGNKEDILVVSKILGEQLKTKIFIVHRLDEGTSGVLLFARTAYAHKKLCLMFEGHEIEKTYLCVVKGVVEGQTIQAPIFKLPSKKNKSVVSEKGKPSTTEVKTLKTENGYSLIEAKPKTGRSHQIRVHLAHIGYPLVGDKLYGGETLFLGEELKYPLLHAYELSFEWEGRKIRLIAKTKTIGI